MEGGDLHTWREEKQHWETVDIPYSTYRVRYVHLSLRNSIRIFKIMVLCLSIDTELDSMYGCRYLYTGTGTMRKVNFVQPALISTKI